MEDSRNFSINLYLVFYFSSFSNFVEAERTPSYRAYPSKAQLFIFNILKNHFKDVEIFLEFPHQAMQFDSEQVMTLDIFIPSFNLAFEYQG